MYGVMGNTMEFFGDTIELSCFISIFIHRHIVFHRIFSLFYEKVVIKLALLV